MKVVFWVGSTATGKSSLALDLAPQFGAAIVNADSVQMYQRLDIGSAKPTRDEQRRAPHFLFDCVKPPETVTAGEFNRRFFELTDEIKNKFPVIFVVGGTGFYYQAIEKGLLPIPKANPAYQAKIFAGIEKSGSAEKYHQELKRLDPETGGRIHVRDHYRIARALDIIQATGKPVSQILHDHETSGPKFPFPLLKIGLKRPKEELEPLVRERTTRMIADGWIDEVRGLLSDGLKDWEPLRSVGYKQCVEFLSNELSSQELPDKIVQETMKLAKKQRTWFSRDPAIEWFHPSEKARLHSKLETFL